VERRDFAARVEFRLAPGAEGGMEIRYPGYGNGALTGMCEIQILDDSHPSYANVDPRQFNGSAYGIVPATRGHLKPLGEWNVQEVTVQGSTVKVELNGVAILNADLAPIREFAGAKPHQGKDRTSGYFGLQCGPGTNQGNVEFRKIEIRDLPRLGSVSPTELRPSRQIVTAHGPQTQVGERAGDARHPDQQPAAKDLVISDRLRKGTVWSGNLEDRYTGGEIKTNRLTFTITERKGTHFKALFALGGQLREVNGNIENRKIHWFAKDTRVIKGFAGFDCAGRVENDHMVFEYSGTNPYNNLALAGAAHLILESR
jgi:hypothetical protein